LATGVSLVKKLRISVNGISYDVEVEVLEDDEGGYGFPYAPPPHMVPSSPVAVSQSRPVNVPSTSSFAPSAGGQNQVTSPIAGVIAEVKVSVGEMVKEHDLLVVIEAMKMHTNLSSPAAGKVKEIKVKPGDAVQQGQVILTFE